jgi:Gpi18-like mannosyltransferase
MTLLLERLKNFFTRYKSFEDWVFSTRFLEFLFLAVALGLSGLVRYLGIRFESGDYLAYLSDWYDYITAHNYWLALRDNFSNYNPPYLYLLIIASSFGGDRLISIKLISIIFDYILAVLVYFVVKNLIKNKPLKSENQNQLIPAKSIPILAFFSILFSPNIILNSAVWSQSDVIYTVFLVASFWFLLKDKFIWTIVFFTAAVSFKLQAIFLIPILAVLFVKRKITLLHFLVAPVVYLIMMLPAAIAGKSWGDIFKVYTEQGNAYQDLTKNAPSLWALFGGADYEIFSNFGFGLAGIFVLGLVYLFWKKDIQDKAKYWLNLGLISAVAIPWFLPKMHDRYFFVADVLSIIYAFYFPKKFWLAIVINLTSFLVYTNYLFGSETVSLPILSLVIFGVIVYLLYSNLNKIYKEKATTV